MLVVAATALELALIQGVDTLCCGIGPVEASIVTARALAARGHSAVLHIGIAGARNLDPPALVLGSESIYCDLIDSRSKLPRIERQTPDPALLEAAIAALPGVAVMPIATSARVGGGDCADVEAMEGFGVLRAAALASVPAVELRAISNLVGESDRSRWRIQEALELLANAAIDVIEALERG